MEVVKTSQQGWLETLAGIYRNRQPVVLLDDAGLGVDPTSQTLLEMARRANLTRSEVAAVCVAVGVSAAGMVMITLAFIDPEPTSKLGLLLAGGAMCVLGGGHSAIRILTNHKPPNIKVGPGGIEISWN